MILANNYNEMYDDIQKKIKEKEELLNQQDNFVKDSIHEIHTPLSSIILNSELRNTIKGEDKYSKQIDAAIKTLQITYDDLSFGIKQERSIFETSNINLASFVQEIIEYFNIIAQSNDQMIEHKIESNCEVSISDIELTRLIDNNLSNAIKYSKPNTIISIKICQDKSKKKSISLEFHNHGSIIKDTKAIFNRYKREASDKGGYGLGLSIVKKICDKNNILINVTSNKTDGNSFIYTLKCHNFITAV